MKSLVKTLTVLPLLCSYVFGQYDDTFKKYNAGMTYHDITLCKDLENVPSELKDIAKEYQLDEPKYYKSFGGYQIRFKYQPNLAGDASDLFNGNSSCKVNVIMVLTNSMSIKSARWIEFYNFENQSLNHLDCFSRKYPRLYSALKTKVSNIGLIEFDVDDFKKGEGSGKVNGKFFKFFNGELH